MEPYSEYEIRRFLDIGLDKSLTTTERGTAFQELFRYLLDKVPGIRTRPNTIDPFQSEEVDIAVANTGQADGLAVLANLFLVESKNWDVPVGAPEVSVFINKLTNRSVELGILVAANGITGDRNTLRAAQHVVAMSQVRGIRVLVVTLDELCGVRTVQQLIDLLTDKMLDLIASTTFSV